MAFIQTQGLVIKETKYGEGNKIITLLTARHGKIQAAAKGARSLKSKLAAGCSLFAYSGFVLREGRGELYQVTGAESVHTFYRLSSRIEPLAAATYCCDLISATVPQEQECETILRLALNTLYALCMGEGAAQKKAAFELRLMCELGFAPELGHCGTCGNTEGLRYLSLQDGCALCRHCGRGTPLQDGTLAAMDYIATAPLKQLFAFSVSQSVERELFALCEQYALTHTGRRPKSLDFWHSIV